MIDQHHGKPYLSDYAKLLGFSLLARLVLLHFAETVHADAVSRIFIAIDWLSNPHYITDGYWGPMHHYLNALSMLIFKGREMGPTMLNVLCGSFTTLAIYRIAYNLSGHRQGAFFAGLIYGLSPIVLWVGFQALSEVSYAFFLAFSLAILSQALVDKLSLKHAVVAGLLMTFASATRYEAWVLIPLLGVVALVLSGFRFAVVFGGVAMLFPVSWMIGNHLNYGDFLYSVNNNDVWNLKLEGVNDHMSTVERIKRVLFFPLSFMFNISIPLFGLLSYRAAKALFRRNFDSKILALLVPAVAMFFVFQWKVWHGTLMMHHRFVLTWLVLFLPFAAFVFDGRWQVAKKTAVMWGAITIIPLSFIWVFVPFGKFMAQTNVGKALEEISLGSLHEIQALPRIHDRNTIALIKQVNDLSRPNDGLVLDFFGWDNTYFTALRANQRTFVTQGALNESVHLSELQSYLNINRHGLILLAQVGKLSSEMVQIDSMLCVKSSPTVQLSFEVIDTIADRLLLRYALIENPRAVDAATLENATPYFGHHRNLTYYMAAIKYNALWYNSIRRTAFWKNEPIEMHLVSNAQWLMHEELKN